MTHDGEKPFARTLAAQQLERAERDPRISHGQGATIADWWAAIEAAERMRGVAIAAMHALAETWPDEPTDPPGSEARANWEQAELARLELRADTVELNATPMRCSAPWTRWSKDWRLVSEILCRTSTAAGSQEQPSKTRRSSAASERGHRRRPSSCSAIGSETQCRLTSSSDRPDKARAMGAGASTCEARCAT